MGFKRIINNEFVELLHRKLAGSNQVLSKNKKSTLGCGKGCGLGCEPVPLRIHLEDILTDTEIYEGT